jgi:hypothetical protein
MYKNTQKDNFIFREGLDQIPLSPDITVGSLCLHNEDELMLYISTNKSKKDDVCCIIY